MTKKQAIIISILLFLILAILMALEVTHPTGGAAFLKALF